MGAVGERLGRYAARTGYGRVVRHRDLRLLLGALLVSATGSWAYNVALLAFVYERTGSLAWVSAAGLARFIPMAAVGPYAGVIAERFERIRLMATSDLVCLASQAGLALTAALDGPVVLALVLAVTTTVANSVYFPAVSATIPEIAGEDDLPAANALNATIEELVVIAGPALGGVLLALGSPALAFTADALTFGVSALLVTRIGRRSTPSDVTEGGEAGLARQLSVGLRAIAESGAVAWLIAFCAAASFIYGTDVVLFVDVSQSKLGTGGGGFAYLLVGLGIGGVLAATVIDRLSQSGRLGAAVVAGLIAYSAPTALLTVVHAPAVAFVLQVVRGAGTLVVDVLAITALQRSLAPDLVARVFGVFDSLTIGAIGLGTLLTPAVVGLIGLDGALLTAGLVFPAFALAAYPTLRRLDVRAQARLAGLQPRLAALEQVAIFGPASRTALERLAAEAREIAVPAGSAIVREGEPADALYVLISGSVDIASRGGAGGPERHIRTMGPVSAFGEIGLLERSARTATVTALESCSLYRIRGEAFLEALAAAPASGAFVEAARGRLALTHPSGHPALVSDGV
jgi:predicted MFS family arabinose efflux permease